MRLPLTAKPNLQTRLLTEAEPPVREAFKQVDSWLGVGAVLPSAGQGYVPVRVDRQAAGLELYLGGQWRAVGAGVSAGPTVSGATLASGAVPRHRLTHEDGGVDELSLAGMSGLLGDPQTPLGHHGSHENTGGDEIGVGGLSGLLADPQTPLGHGLLSAYHTDAGTYLNQALLTTSSPTFAGGLFNGPLEQRIGGVTAIPPPGWAGDTIVKLATAAAYAESTASNIFQVFSSITNTGTTPAVAFGTEARALASGSRAFGINTNARADATGATAIGAEIDFAAHAADAHATGLQIINVSTYVTDGAYLLLYSNNPTTLPANLIRVLVHSGAQPIQATGTLFLTEGAVACAGGIDLSSATFSGNAFASAGFSVNGAGAIIAAGLTVDTLTGYLKGTAGVLSGQTGVPHSDLTYSGLTVGNVLAATSATAAGFGATIGAAASYLTTAYITTLSLNSTASLNGATAGIADLTGKSRINDPNTDTTPFGARTGTILLKQTSGVANSWVGIDAEASGGSIACGVSFQITNNTSAYGEIAFGARSATGWLRNVLAINRDGITAGVSVTINEASNIIVGTTTGTKLGTATNQKLGFWNTAPVVQPAHVADATGAGDIVAQFNALLTRLEGCGMLAAA